eukprot:TRINITY_DN5851_c0_g1_i1.p1 TRINITY_DN5851_c0_g1~~TRINITY_DN5851_c0_g1_i1.p1  ORF type:complete len:346 (-),score=53.96 TRINITY_DN5851_c0_g1_i1:436-1473(-)
MSQEVVLALDWTPNGNHCGFFVAKAKGFYEQQGLNVTLASVHVDDYEATPASKVANNSAQFGLCPTESVVSYYTWPDGAKPRVRAVATVFQKDLSCLVTLKSSGIDRPQKLDGKTYASYGARYEGRLVQQMIKNDGGTGEYTEKTMPFLQVWDSVLKGESDSTWVFKTCENIEAETKGIELNSFMMEDYNIPYGYSPIVIALQDYVDNNADVIRKFLKASAEGYRFCAENVDEAAELFVKAVEEEYKQTPIPQPLGVEHVKKSLAALKDAVLDADGKWGKMSPEQWRKYIDWLHDNQLLTTMVQSRQPVEGVSTSLDKLRAGESGELIPRENVKDKELFTNKFLE